METPLEIDVADAARRLAGGAVLLDVREPFERDIAQISGSEAVPMREIPSRLEALPRDRELLVLCHHGGRSLRVTQFLRAQGFPHATNVRGGIDAWAEQIDPKLARY